MGPLYDGQAQPAPYSSGENEDFHYRYNMSRRMPTHQAMMDGRTSLEWSSRTSGRTSGRLSAPEAHPLRAREEVVATTPPGAQVMPMTCAHCHGSQCMLGSASCEPWCRDCNFRALERPSQGVESLMKE